MKQSLRLNQNEIKIIKQSLSKYGNIYIFGSQTNPEKKGGDIDIFITQKIPFEEKLKLKIKLQEKLLKKIDLIDHKDFNRNIEKEALKGIKI